MKLSWRRAGWPAIPVLTVLLLAGCGGSHGSDEASPDPVTSTSPADVESTSPDDGSGGDDSGSYDSDDSDGSDSDSGSDSDADSDSDTTVPSEIRVTDVDDFELTQGQASWESSAENRAANVVLDLDGDGSFSFTTVDTVGVPVTGSYTVSGSEVDFEGETETPGAAGSSTLEIQGSVDLDEQTMSLHWIASSGMGAVVDGQSFSSANAETWDAELEVSLDGD